MIEYDSREYLESDASCGNESDKTNKSRSRKKSGSILSDKSEYNLQRSYEINDDEKSLEEEYYIKEKDSNNSSIINQSNVINNNININSHSNSNNNIYNSRYISNNQGNIGSNNNSLSYFAIKNAGSFANLNKNNKTKQNLKTNFNKSLNMYLEEQDYNTRKTSSCYGTSNNENNNLNYNTKNENNEGYIEQKTNSKVIDLFSREEFQTCKNEVDYIFSQYETPNSNKMNTSNVFDNSNIYNPRLTTDNNFNSQKLDNSMIFYESCKKDNYLGSNKIENDNFLSNKYESYSNLNSNNNNNELLENTCILYQETDKSQFDNSKYFSSKIEQENLQEKEKEIEKDNIKYESKKDKIDIDNANRNDSFTENDNYDQNIDMINGFNLKSQVDTCSSNYSDPQ